MTAYSMVKSNFIFQRSPPSRENFLGENFFAYDGVFPGRIKFYFAKSPPPLGRIFFGENFFGHDSVFPGRIKFYFPKAPPPHGRISLVRISLVTTTYSLVEYNFFFQRSPPWWENILGDNFFCHDGVSPGWIKFFFWRPTPLVRISLVRIFLVTTAYSLVETNFIFQSPLPLNGRISLVRISLVTKAYSLVELNFFFQKPPPLLWEFHWWEFHWLRWRIPWLINFYCQKGPCPPNRIISLVRISLVTTAYSMVESNLIF